MRFNDPSVMDGQALIDRLKKARDFDLRGRGESR
jgi:hypothetical protein